MKRQIQNMNTNGITSRSIPPLADLIHIAHHQRLQLLKAFCSSLLLKAVKKLHTWRPYAMSLPMLPVASVCKVYFCWRLWRNFTHGGHMCCACRCCHLLQFVKQSTSAEGCEETSHTEATHTEPAYVASCFSLLRSNTLTQKHIQNSVFLIRLCVLAIAALQNKYLFL